MERRIKVAIPWIQEEAKDDFHQCRPEELLPRPVRFLRVVACSSRGAMMATLLAIARSPGGHPRFTFPPPPEYSAPYGRIEHSVCTW
jgi:hypothetical protein